MITKEAVEILFGKACVDFEKDCPGCFVHMLLKERDEALAKADAYREVARNFLSAHKIYSGHNDLMLVSQLREYIYAEVDAEAQRIMAGRGGE